MILLNGAAARKTVVGDLVIITTYAEVEEHELAGFEPRLVYVDGDNRILQYARRRPAAGKRVASL